MFRPIGKDSAEILHAGRESVGGAWIHYSTVGLCVAVLDALVITLGSVAAQTVYEALDAFNGHELSHAFGIGFACSVLYVPTAFAFRAYNLPALLEPRLIFRSILLCCGIVILSMTGILFLLKVGSLYSRGALLGFGLVMTILCLLERLLVAAVVRRMVAAKAIAGESVFLIGDPEELETLTPSTLLRQFGFREVGRFSTAGATALRPNAMAQFGHALAAARQHRAKQIVIAVNGRSADELREIEQAVRQTPLPVTLLPNSVSRSIIARKDIALTGALHCIELKRAPLSRTELAAKRVVDIAGSLSGLIVLAPVLVVVACLIKFTSPGPVVFRQTRNGFDEVPFTIYKFRTMTVTEDGEDVVQARRGDARITRIGAILRRTSLDELPQLLNVLRGEMSLVGPRPHALVHDKEYRMLIGSYFRRHHVKPGMTGWAQIHGLRGETVNTADMQQRVEHDIWYIDNWSISLEISILARTIFSFSDKNAC